LPIHTCELGRPSGCVQCPGEEPSGRGKIPLRRGENVDDLSVLVDRPVQVHPASGDLEIGLVDEPAVPGDVPAGPGGVDQLGGEPLHPPVDRDVIHGDAAFGEEVLHVAVGQAVAQDQRTASVITFGGNRNPAKLDRGAATAAGR
jgi:hypothetical protein